MKKYSLNLEQVKNKEIRRGHIKQGGVNLKGDKLSFTNYYIELNDKPFFGISGEFHFSRFPYMYWEEEIIKMKLSGCNIIASYILWIHHEEEEGKFNWDGSNNLRYFLELCNKHNMYVILRVGPFCHAEARNGGFPDWLYGKPFTVRTNDEGYLKYVKRLYGEIGTQIKGQLFREGGPVIGIQLENEFGHAGAPWEFTVGQAIDDTGAGSDYEHLRVLKEIAARTGLVPPIYTFTRWPSDNYGIDGFQLSGGYSYRPWRIKEKNMIHPPTTDYLYGDHHKDSSEYPYGFCELMGGMQVWYKYRFIVPGESIPAISANRVAAGSNFLGYYMYHGGSNPVGKHSYMNEYTTPKISYDFQAPIREFGQINDSYRMLKPLHIFYRDFAETFCKMRTVLPEGNEKIVPEDTETLRYAARVRDNSGFLFINNFQDHLEMTDKEDIFIDINLKDEVISLPKKMGLSLKKDANCILPFNLNLGEAQIKYALAQLITKITEGAEDYYFFYTPNGMNGEYCFSNEGISVINIDNGNIEKDDKFTYVYPEKEKMSLVSIETSCGEKITICNLTWEQALNFWKIDIWGKERIVLSEANLLGGSEYIKLCSTGKSEMNFKVFPALDVSLSVAEWEKAEIREERENIFQSYYVKVEDKKIELNTNINRNKATLSLSEDAFDNIEDIFLRINYKGDVGNAFIDGRLINDNFYNGTTWEIGLKRFYPEVIDKEIYFYVKPLKNGEYITIDSAMDLKTKFVGETIAQIDNIEAVPEYRVMIINKKTK